MRAARAGRRIVMRPTEHGFVGPLAGELEEYIRFKASMGRHGATRVQVLRSFDRHCLEHGAVRLERGVVERWIAHRIDANPGGCRSWFSYIRDFGRWMRLAHDPDAYVLSDQWKAGSPRPTPYLLTDREAALFLRAAGTLESPSPWAWQSRAFFMLMACCGLRTREVRRLAVGHVCLCSISCCGFSHDDFSGLGRACRPRNGLNWMVLVSPPERTGKDYDQHAPSTVYPSFAAERGIRRVDRAENTCQRADGA